MAEVAAHATKPPAPATKPPVPVLPRRLLSQPGEPAERRAHARATSALRGDATPPPSPPLRLAAGDHLPPDAPAEIAAQARHGRPLPADRAADYGVRLGADLRAVRVHDDAAAASLADAADARAFTVGSHVFFNRDEHRPDTVRGRALLAHELAHAVETPDGPARIYRQPKSVVTLGEPEVIGMPAPQKEVFERLQVNSDSMDHAALTLAANVTAENIVFVGLSPQFFKVYDYRGNKIGRVDTKDGESITFLPGIYVEGKDGLVAITQSNLDPNKLGKEADAEGRERSVIGQRKLSEQEQKAQDEERKKAAKEKRTPKPVADTNVSINAMTRDPNALKALVDQVSNPLVYYFVPNFPKGTAGGKGGGEKASAFASPIIGGRADGEPANAPPWPVTMDGPKLVPVDSDPTFEAKIDWSANGNFSFANQVISQVGEDIHYRWELFDVTEYADKELAKVAARRKSEPGAPPHKSLQERIKEFTEAKKGAGKNVTGMGGANREFKREFEDWWSDTKRSAKRIARPHGDTVEERLASTQVNMVNLEMAPTSLLVTAVHAAIRWFADLFAGPRKQQEIPLETEGIFLIRVITTPAINEDTTGKKVVRPPSVDAKLVEVTPMQRAVDESLDEPEAQLAELRAQIEDAKKHKYTDKAAYLQNLFDEANLRYFGAPFELLERRREVKEAELKEYRAKYPNLSAYEKELAVEKIDDQIAAFLRHEAQRTAGDTSLGTAQRVNGTLISEVTGEQYPLLLTAGPMAMEDGRQRWLLSDITSGDGHAYVGRGDTATEAFSSALEKFGDNAAYGRGRIGVSTEGVGLEASAPKRIYVDSAPADEALAYKRIDDLVTTLALLGLVVESAGTAAVLLGAAAAAAKLIKRWQANELKPNAETVGDLLSVLGGFAAAGEIVAGLRLQKFQGAFTVLKAGEATEAELTQVGELIAGAASLAKAAEAANELIGYAGMIWGNLGFIDNILAINGQEARGEITHAGARRARADAISSAIQNNVLVFLGKAIKSRKQAKAAAARPSVPHEKVPGKVTEPGEDRATEEEHPATGAEKTTEEQPPTAKSKPGAAEHRESTHAELRQVLPPDLRDLLVFGGVQGDTVDIEWTRTSDGLVGDIKIHAGPETSPGMLRLHIETVRTMQRYQGFSGRVRKVMNWVLDVFGVDALDPSKPSFRSRLEIDKLTRIVAEQMNAMARMEPNARANAETQLDILRTQLDEHLAALDIGEMNPLDPVSARGPARKDLKKYTELLAELRTYRPGSKEHRRIRRKMYELTGGKLDIDSWNRVYDANMRNAERANKIVDQERVRLGWNKQAVEYTIEMKKGPARRLDLANEATLEGAEVKAYREGTVYLNEDIEEEVVRDATIVKQGWKLTWIFVDCEPSGPLHDALLAAGISIEMRKSNKNGSSTLTSLITPLRPPSKVKTGSK